MTFMSTEEVVIRWRSDRALVGSVRDSAGIWDVTFDGSWHCSCGEYACCHVLAIKGIATVAS